MLVHHNYHLDNTKEQQLKVYSTWRSLKKCKIGMLGSGFETSKSPKLVKYKWHQKSENEANTQSQQLD